MNRSLEFEGASFVERRRAFRIKLPVLAYVRRENGRLERWDVEDLSTSGMLCRAYEPQVGEVVRLAINIPGHGVTSMLGRAVGIRSLPSGGSGVAVALLQVPAAYEDTVQDAITGQLEALWPSHTKRAA